MCGSVLFMHLTLLFTKSHLMPTEVSFQAKVFLNRRPDFDCFVPNVLWPQTVVRMLITSETLISLN